eukprot:jgi/Bigna1/127194/aug1.4_g1902
MSTLNGKLDWENWSVMYQRTLTMDTINPQHISYSSTKSIVNTKACCAADASGEILPLKGGNQLEEAMANDCCLKCLLLSMCPCCLCTLGGSCFAPHCYLYCCYGQELLDEYKAQAAQGGMGGMPGQ